MAISTKAKKEVIFFLSKLIYSVVLISLCSKRTQLYMYTFFFILFSIKVYLRRLDIAPCAIYQDLLVYPF